MITWNNIRGRSLFYKDFRRQHIFCVTADDRHPEIECYENSGLFLVVFFNTAWHNTKLNLIGKFLQLLYWTLQCTYQHIVYNAMNKLCDSVKHRISTNSIKKKWEYLHEKFHRKKIFCDIVCLNHCKPSIMKSTKLCTNYGKLSKNQTTTNSEHWHLTSRYQQKSPTGTPVNIKAVLDNQHLTANNKQQPPTDTTVN